MISNIEMHVKCVEASKMDEGEHNEVWDQLAMIHAPPICAHLHAKHQIWKFFSSTANNWKNSVQITMSSYSLFT